MPTTDISEKGLESLIVAAMTGRRHDEEGAPREPGVVWEGTATLRAALPTTTATMLSIWRSCSTF